MLLFQHVRIGKSWLFSKIYIDGHFIFLVSTIQIHNNLVLNENYNEQIDLRKAILVGIVSIILHFVIEPIVYWWILYI